MIPKTIHYCWFGRNPLPAEAKKCLRSWRHFCRGWEIVEWNEDSYDLAAAPLYVREAYEAKKWAFVTDYVRLDAVYRHGGVYLDTDVELIKSPERFLHDAVFMGLESEEYVNTGLGFGAEKGAAILREMMEDYQGVPFLLPDGSFDLTPCPVRNTEILLRHGFVPDGSEQLLDGTVHIYPKKVFNPWNKETSRFEDLAEAASIHWFAGSWCAAAEEQNYVRRQLKRQRRRRIKQRLKGVLGGRASAALGKAWRGIKARAGK